MNEKVFFWMKEFSGVKDQNRRFSLKVLESKSWHVVECL